MGEESDESDAEFDEGFKVPGFLFKKLFKYVSDIIVAIILEKSISLNGLKDNMSQNDENMP